LRALASCWQRLASRPSVSSKYGSSPCVSSQPSAVASCAVALPLHPAIEHIGVDVQIPGRLSAGMALIGHQPNRISLELLA